MPAILERLALFAFAAARALFILQGLGFACAWLAAGSLAPSDAPPWLADSLRSLLWLSLVFVAGGLGLVAASRWRPAPAAAGAHTPGGPWPSLLALTLLGCAALAASAGAELPALWRELGALLTRIGFWDALAQPGPGSAALLPVLLALGVPLLTTAAVVAGLVLPLLLLPLLFARRRLFPVLLAMVFFVQLTLALGSALAVSTTARLFAEATASMAASGDAEALRDVEPVVRASATLAATTQGLAAPLLAIFGWLVFLRPSGAAASWFHAGGSPAVARASARGAEGSRSAAPTPEIGGRSALPPEIGARRAGASADARPARERESTHRTATRAPRLARLALAALGAALLLFGALDALRTRPTFAGSEPAPGARLDASPDAVRVRFAAPVDSASSLRLTRLALPPYEGQQPSEVALTPRLASGDAERRTLEALPGALPPGVYRVSWSALPAAGGVPRHGSFSFGVGIAVPADEPGTTHSLLDRDAGERSRRKTLAGGALLLALGLMLPVFAPRASGGGAVR